MCKELKIEEVMEKTFNGKQLKVCESMFLGIALLKAAEDNNVLINQAKESIELVKQAHDVIVTQKETIDELNVLSEFVESLPEMFKL